MSVAAQSEYICDDPEPRVRFRKFAHPHWILNYWVGLVTPELRGRTLDNLNTTIYKRFIQEEIEIPYTKQDVYIKSLPEIGVSKN